MTEATNGFLLATISLSDSELVSDLVTELSSASSASQTVAKKSLDVGI